MTDGERSKSNGGENGNDAKDGTVQGAALVVGGGVAGMQTALDLAEAGFKVHLVERESAIGGTMAQLDKTFPTNDCAMCIISPKLVEVGRHLNIDVLTNAEVTGVRGEAGNFEVDLHLKPRHVDPLKCTACGECSKVCPVERTNAFNEGLDSRKAIYKRYPQAVPNTYCIEKKGIAPCQATCPAHIHVQGYVQLIRAGKFAEALALIKRDNPFPAICGRVCTHPCEAKCTRGQVDEPIAINALKRFVSDWELKNGASGLGPASTEIKPERIAILGGGPAGLSCAHYLALNGYRSTIFEALPVLGGMAAVGIPSYRLPRAIWQKEVDDILKLGLTDVKLGVRVGKDVSLKDLRAQYAAVFVAVGAHRPIPLDIEGEGLEGVLPGVDFLRDVSFDRPPVLTGRRVAVIGGGNVAFDSIRTAMRLGAKKVTLLYRRTRAEMPAAAEEIEEAEEEGIDFQYLVAPKRIVAGKGAAARQVKAIECIRMKLGAPDGSGRRRPIPIDGSEFTIEVDTILSAVGQKPDLTFVEGDCGFEVSKWGTIAADELTGETLTPTVFAGGDAVLGPATLIQAIAAGKEAAESIHRALRGLPVKAGRGEAPVPFAVDTEGIEREPRAHPPMLDAVVRRTNFDEVRQALTEEQARSEASRCLNCAVCSECLECVKVCMPNAIDHDEKPRTMTLGVGAMVLAPGLEMFDPCRKAEYGYRRYKNVVTSLEFERILSASGPTAGHIQRPSDGVAPRRVAWIQCVGSRDQTLDRGYCSSVCCTYAMKEAVVAKEHEPGLDTTVFYIDIRTYGKGFERYFEQAKQRGVRFVRSLASRVVEKPGSGNLIIRFTGEDGKSREEEFDMVVLSVGLSPHSAAKALLDKVGLEAGPHGFLNGATLSPLATKRKGVFAVGAFQGPKDIPETVAQASAAAALAGGLLHEARHTATRKKEYPPEKPVCGEAPRIGVVVCRCGFNIASVVDVPGVASYAKNLPGVAYTEERLFACSQDSLKHMQELVEKEGLNRVVVASCSPRTHEPLFRSTLREGGLNQYLFSMANIRDQCSWVHQKEHEAATEKAKDLVRMAVANARHLQPLQEVLLPVNHRAVVVGGGLAGMTSALTLADQGFGVTLVEKNAELGGNLKHLRRSLEGEDVAALREDLVRRVCSDPKIEVLTQTHVVGHGGFKGNFCTELSVTNGAGTDRRKVEHGALIVATGAHEYKPKEYLYGQDPRVVTQLDFEGNYAAEAVRALREVVIIQCVGSRCPERGYCSRVCCATALKNAVWMKKQSPETRITVLYRDIRSYGLLESMYTEARELGVRFVRFELEDPPKVETNGGGKLTVAFREPLIDKDMVLEPDLVVLSGAIVPEENEELASQLKVARTEDGFFLEAHLKLRPVDFASDGIYLAGMASQPQLMRESVVMAQAAAGRAATLLAQEGIRAGGAVARVNPEVCASCLTCVRACPYNVPRINADGVAEIEAAACQGCGICASECPAKAIQVEHFRDEQILDIVESLFEGKNQPAQSHT